MLVLGLKWQGFGLPFQTFGSTLLDKGSGLTRSTEGLWESGALLFFGFVRELRKTFETSQLRLDGLKSPVRLVGPEQVQCNWPGR